jgi:hypothetical protein
LSKADHTAFRYVFDDPVTVSGAQGRITKLRGEIMNIEVQLGDRDHKAVDGNRLDPIAFSKWRQGAKFAIRHRSAEIDYLKGWIARRQDNRLQSIYRRLQLQADNPDCLLALGYRVLRALARERRVTFDDEEQTVIDAINRYFGPIIQANGKVVAPPILVVTGDENGGDTSQPSPTPSV